MTLVTTSDAQLPPEGQTPEGGGPMFEQTAPPRPRRTGVLPALGRAVMAALLVVVLAVGIAVILVPAVTGSQALTVLTSSMEPNLPPGTMVIVKPTDPADIEPGMVMTYQLESGKPLLVTHRVLQRLTTVDGEYLFITQGDANPQPDADPVREVQIRGTVWYAVPYVGWVATAISGDFRSMLVTVVVIGLIGYALWMFGSALFSRRKTKGATGN